MYAKFRGKNQQAQSARRNIIAGKRDEKAPKVIMLKITGPNGESWGELVAAAKEFKTGSVGFYASGKIVNPANPEATYQVGCNITLVGSKTDA